MELRFAVVEDRLPDAQRLESLLRLAFGGGQPLVCDHYESGDAFLAAFPSKNYQVVFLDICMEGTNGIETARILRRADPDLLLVFVTALGGAGAFFYFYIYKHRCTRGTNKIK